MEYSRGTIFKCHLDRRLGNRYIELPKFEKYKDNSALASWVKFINNPRVVDMNNEEIKKL